MKYNAPGNNIPCDPIFGGVTRIGIRAKAIEELGKWPPKRATSQHPVTENTTTTTSHCQLQAMIDQGVTAALAARDANRNGDDSHYFGKQVQKDPNVLLRMHYKGLHEWPSSVFKGTEEWSNEPWFERMETGFLIVGLDVAKLALLCVRMFPEESDKFMDKKSALLLKRQAEKQEGNLTTKPSSSQLSQRGRMWSSLRRLPVKEKSSWKLYRVATSAVSPQWPMHCKMRKLQEEPKNQGNMLKVTGTHGMVLALEKREVRFGKRGKLNPRYVGPSKVMEKFRSVAYKLEFPQELSKVHKTFHVSNLKKCHSDKPLAVPLEGLHIDDKLYFIKKPT
ncbi:hypothetical protein Tco_0004886 [Tanacetum coccineum]